MTTTKKNVHAQAATCNEDKMSIRERSVTNPTRLTQAIANVLLELILDTKFQDRAWPIDAGALTFQDVQDICDRFQLPLAEVLEGVTREVQS